MEFINEMVNEMATKQKEEDPLVSELLGTVISENTGKTLSRQDYIDQIMLKKANLRDK